MIILTVAIFTFLLGNWSMQYNIVISTYFIMSLIFVFALFRIRRIVKGLEMTSLNSCYMMCHFLAVFVHILQWAFLKYGHARKRNLFHQYEKTGDICYKLEFEKMRYRGDWEQMTIGVPSAVGLDLIVLYLILRFSKETGERCSQMGRKKLNDITQLKNRKVLTEVVREENRQ